MAGQHFDLAVSSRARGRLESLRGQFALRESEVVSAIIAWFEDLSPEEQADVLSGQLDGDVRFTELEL